MTALALAAPPGAVVRDTRWGSDSSRHLMLSTRLTSPGRREAAVLTTEVSLARLFEAIPSASGAASGAALVDLTTDTVVAGSRTDRVAAGAGGPGARPLGDLRVHINGITSGHAGTARTLASAGWVSTAVPLWQASDGTQFGLIHVWPVVPDADQTLLVAALVGFALIVLAHRRRRSPAPSCSPSTTWPGRSRSWRCSTARPARTRCTTA